MIEIVQLSKNFNSLRALSDLSFKVNPGEIYALLGANGAGKTTTINILLGFIQPTSGKAMLDNLPTHIYSTEVRKRVSYIPENVNLYPYLSGIENLKYFCSLAGIKKHTKELSDILKKCGLAEEFHHLRVSNYSKGMRQKVGIAVAYAKNAKVLLLDEPSSGLDPSSNNELTSQLKELAAQGASVLMASHDLFRVKETATKIGILRHGKLAIELAAEELSAKSLEELYLGYMNN